MGEIRIDLKYKFLREIHRAKNYNAKIQIEKCLSKQFTHRKIRVLNQSKEKRKTQEDKYVLKDKRKTKCTEYREGEKN